MKRLTLVLLITISLFESSYAQVKSLKKTMELAMPATKASGQVDACMTYNTALKKYYCAYIGDRHYPMAIFTDKGQLVSNTDLAAEADLHALWYNSESHSIQGIAEYEGWVNYALDATGNPGYPKKFADSPAQLDRGSSASFDDKTKTLYFYDKYKNEVQTYDLKGNKGKTIQLDPPKEDANGNQADYNDNTVVYTGIPGKELGLYDTDGQKVDLYNLSTGKKVISWKLPEDSPLRGTNSYNFTYCNGILWLFNIDSHKWIGYK